MERVLTQLFDFQLFDQNAELQRVIDEVHDRYAVRELSLDEMELLAAAGTPDQALLGRGKKEGLKKHDASGYGTGLPGVSR